MCNKFPYFCLGIRHGSLGVVCLFGGFFIWFYFPIKIFGLHGNLEQLLGSLTRIPVAARKVFCSSHSYAVLVFGRKCKASQKCSLSWNNALFISVKTTCEFTCQVHLQGDFSAAAIHFYPLIQFSAPDATSVNSVVAAGSKCCSSSSGRQTSCHLDTIHENSFARMELEMSCLASLLSFGLEREE